MVITSTLEQRESVANTQASPVVAPSLSPLRESGRLSAAAGCDDAYMMVVAVDGELRGMGSDSWHRPEWTKDLSAIASGGDRVHVESLACKDGYAFALVVSTSSSETPEPGTRSLSLIATQIVGEDAFRWSGGVDIMDMTPFTSVSNLVLRDGYAWFVTGDPSQLHRYTLSDPSLLAGTSILELQTSYVATGFKPSIAVTQDSAFVTANNAVVAIDLTDPTYPLVVQHIYAPGIMGSPFDSALDIAVMADEVVVSSGDGIWTLGPVVGSERLIRQQIGFGPARRPAHINFADDKTLIVSHGRAPVAAYTVLERDNSGRLSVGHGPIGVEEMPTDELVVLNGNLYGLHRNGGVLFFSWR
jgi:hypothetical protein